MGGGEARALKLGGSPQNVRPAGKEALELALVWCEDGRRRAERASQVGSEPFEGGQRVGIEHQAAMGMSGHGDQGPRRRVNAKRRPEHERVDAFVFEDALQIVRTAAPLQHDRGQVSGVHADRLRWRGNRDEARSDAQGASCGKPRRTRSRRAAREHHRVPALVFVRRKLRFRKGISPEARPVGEGLAAKGRRGSSGAIPMSARVSRPHRARPGKRRWPGLAGREGHGPLGSDGDAPHLTRIAVDSRGDVD